LTICTLFTILSLIAYAQGIGVSPDRIDLEPGYTKTLWLTNPNTHAITVLLESDCDAITFSQTAWELDARSRASVRVSAAPQPEGCSGFITVSIADEGSDGVSILPSVQVPLVVSASVASYEVKGLSTSWDRLPERSQVTGIFTSLSVIVVGLLCYYSYTRWKIVPRK
jgi:hypothetical protein